MISTANFIRALAHAEKQLASDDFTLRIASFNVMKGVYSFTFFNQNDGHLQTAHVNATELKKG